MASAREIAFNVARLNGLPVTDMVKVSEEDTDEVDSIKHICRFGLKLLDKKRIEFNYPMDNLGRHFKPVVCTIWNCNNCGKTYYNVVKIELSPMTF